MIDESLSHLSDLAFEGAMAGYLVALVCHGVEAASRRTRVAAAEPVLVAAGSAGPAVDGAALDDAVLDGAALDDAASRDAQRRSYTADRVGTAAVAVTVAGLVCHIAALALRGFAAHRLPWGNMYEFTLMITGAAVASWLVVLWRNRTARPLGVYVMTAMVILVFLAGTVLYTRASPVVPILNSYWLVIHVTIISLSSGVLLLSGLAAFAYLMRLRHDAKVASGALTGARAETKLPAADKLDRIAYRTAIAAFPFYTFGIIAGALWAEVAWGKYWSWDPKETVALVTWVVYAGYLHARATAGWRGKPAAWISVVGLATIIFNLFFVNMVVSGLHSYAGLN